MTAGYPINSPRFRGVRDECQQRMGSFKNVYMQISGTGTKTIFSPTNANKWMKYANSGVQVYKFTNKDFTKYFGDKWAKSTPRTTCQYLRQKYGNTIKDAVRGKGNCWLIAANKTPGARPFTSYNWK